MRTLWVCNVAGGPFEYTPVRPGHDVLGLENAHRDLKISPEEFDEVAAELARTLTASTCPRPRRTPVPGAFAAHKGEVTEDTRLQWALEPRSSHSRQETSTVPCIVSGWMVQMNV